MTGDSVCDDWENGKLYATGRYHIGQINLHITTVKKAIISSWKNTASKKAQVVFKKVTGAEGYEIQYSTNKE